MKKRIIFLVSVLILSAMILSCGGSAAVTGGSAASKQGKSEPMPEWVVNPPLDNAYYIGVGSGTNTDDAIARDNAIYRAKSYLAGDILTQISTETKVHDFENSKGERYEEYESNILATMEANLQGTEIVDEWEAKDGTYWVYMRLSIALWKKIQAEEMAALDKRVRDLVEPLVNASNKTIVEKLTALWKGWELVYNSPYAGVVDTQMFGENGDLLDTIEKKIVSYVNSLSIDVPYSNLVFEYGRPIDIKAEITTYFDDKVGKVPIAFYLDNGSEPAIKYNSDSSGNFEGTFSIPGLKLGKTNVVARIDLAEFGIDQDRMITQMIVPESNFFLDYQQVKVSLEVDNPDSSLAGVTGGVKALFSERELPFKIDNASKNEYTIHFELVIEDVPENDQTGGIRFCYLRGVISLIKNGKSLYSYETEKYKGSGLDLGQAHERGWKVMLDRLDDVDELYKGLMDSLDLD